MSHVLDNLNNVLQRIKDACIANNRDPEEIRRWGINKRPYHLLLVRPLYLMRSFYVIPEDSYSGITVESADQLWFSLSCRPGPPGF